ncbi:putative monooxygenase p33MONOX [Astyanax mexicanus]|uniref:Putative monooxygenase p33MONOX n=1 Tax=Astyanax mexicanus TaxID=7994 RepID=A0A8T2LL45_ASTMX|nr:putative monooxygenase p33MONOX [Astyanax mexicanus]
MRIGDFEDWLPTSAPFTSVSSPISLQRSNPGSLLGRVLCYFQSDISSFNTDIMGGNEGGGRGLDRWSLFGARPVVQKSPTDPGSDSSTSGGFSLQSYFGVPKSTTLDGIKTQVNLSVEDPANFKSAKIDVGGVEGKKAPPHKLKHRDMNILTPSGF